MKRLLLPIVFVLLLAIVLAVKYSPGAKSIPRAPSFAPPLAQPVAAARQTRAVEFRSDGLNERLLHVNEGVAGADNVRVAALKKGEGTFVLVLTPGVAKYFTLDGDWTLNDFPTLNAAGFQTPPPPLAQTMSIFRSLTKRELGYSVERGDRIVILVAPKEDWPALKLKWPER